ncbi:hypothetical protein QTP88_000325 [Uroleucon formosanum]
MLQLWLITLDQIAYNYLISTLTASIFGKICKLRESTSRDKVAKELLFGTFTGNTATNYGIQHEDMAKEQLEKVIGKNIKNVGLIIDHGLSFSAASPNGLVGNNALVEIKCPASAKSMSQKTETLQK